jgi:hypothetical protein
LKGSSAGHLPSQVKRKKLPIKDQNTKRATGEKLNPLKRSFLLEILKKKRETTDKAKASTPPNLLGIERRIAYANKKYHSG